MNDFNRMIAEHEDQFALSKQISNVLYGSSYVQHKNNAPVWHYAKKIRGSYIVLADNPQGGSSIVRICTTNGSLDGGNNWVELVKAYKMKHAAVEFYKKQDN